MRRNEKKKKIQGSVFSRRSGAHAWACAWARAWTRAWTRRAFFFLTAPVPFLPCTFSFIHFFSPPSLSIFVKSREWAADHARSSTSNSWLLLPRQNPQVSRRRWKRKKARAAATKFCGLMRNSTSMRKPPFPSCTMAGKAFRPLSDHFDIRATAREPKNGAEQMQNYKQQRMDVQ